MKEFIASLGPVCAIVGAQWGDEGKGKATDILAEHFDIIARACGGAYAGHTIVLDDTKHVFHLLPSGCLHENKPIILGPGMVIHFPTLLQEIQTLANAGIDILPRLKISTSAHILFDYHKEIDAALEEQRSQDKGEKIGTTKRGIGPAYMEKSMRTGIRVEQFSSIQSELEQKKNMIESMFDIPVHVDSEIQQLHECAEIFTRCSTDTTAILHSALNDKKTILVEGAQGSALDIDHGTYPFVTSSATTSAGALQGLGLPPACMTSCIGIAKAYCTRVGSGDFSTEVEGEVGDRIRDRGGEYGATTARPRRCGWLHMSDLQKSAAINGISHWNITKLDVLDEEVEVPVMIDSEYISMTGWQTSTAGMTDYSQLPENAQKYIERIEQKTNVPVSLIGTGPKRSEMIVRSYIL